uniref:BBSome complex member BBS5 PH domain-containing protein n=1 Tax=Timema bartmani TaxID=61472 RepID=A0A7R9ET90_9NEOP|nr:unnamed protein product [Timema bartmani]
MALISIPQRTNEIITNTLKVKFPTHSFINMADILWEDKEVRFDVPLIQMRMRPGENVLDRMDPIEDTKGNGGDRGRLVITNLRIIWHSLTLPRINLSIGLNTLMNVTTKTVNSVRIRESKFGTALVVESAEQSGGYVLGFRIDPAEKLHMVYKELSSLHKVYSLNPVFGVQFTVTDQAKIPDESPPLEDDIEEVDETGDEMSNAFVAYFADGGHERDREPVYSPELGLAIEKLKEGFTLKSLWEVIPST